MKKLTRKSWNQNLVSKGFPPLSEEEWDLVVKDLAIDAKEKEEYKRWNMDELLNGRG